jgi:hypothetical protein
LDFLHIVVILAYWKFVRNHELATRLGTLGWALFTRRMEQPIHVYA